MRSGERLATLPALTGIRFVAAMMVFLYHSGAGFLAERGAPEPLVNALANGYLGVSLFFVLSGFILTYSYRSEPWTTRSFRRYAISRFARIYPVYLFALLVALVIARPPLAPADVLSALTLLQAWTPPASSHGFIWITQAWTLSVELFFYLAFPILLLTFERSPRALSIVVAMLSVALIVTFGLSSITPETGPIPIIGAQTPIWLPVLRLAEFAFGMSLCLMMLDVRVTRALAGAGWQLVIATAMVFVMATAHGTQAKALFTILAGLLIVSLAFNEGAVSRILAMPLFELLGAASYALYILQGPIREFCRIVVPSPYDRYANLVVAVPIAVAAYKLVEVPARRFIMRRFADRSPIRSL